MRQKRTDSESDDESLGEEVLIDHEDKRVLNKRKKRAAGKIEECNIDLESFI
jgi:hypothetical protein